jgi:phosphodiesterase/alkaline phosphatase D-like protein
MKKIVAMLAMAVALGLWCTAQTATGSQTQTNAVKITNGPVVENVTDTTAQVAWSTNVNAGSLVQYGTDPNNLDQKASMPWGGLTHRIELKNLKPGTTYYFKAQSDQGQGTGTGAQTAQAQFQTKASGAQASTAPAANPSTSAAPTIVAGPIPQLVKDTSAQIWWLPSQATGATRLTYGTSTANLSQNASVTQESNGASGELAQLSNLQPDTTYYYNVLGPSGNVLFGGQFKTEPTNYAANKNVWITKGPVLEMIGPSSAVVAWSTNVRAGSIVHYGTDQQALNQTATAPWGQDTHRVTINNLKPNTRYYFEVQSTQAQGTNTQAQSQPAPFQTLSQGQQAVMNIQPR